MAHSSALRSARFNPFQLTRAYRRPRMSMGGSSYVRRRIGNNPAAQHTFNMLRSVDLNGPLSATLNSTAAVAILNGVQTGTGFFNRVGNRITMKTIQFVGQLGLTGNASTSVNEWLRVMIVYDKQANGATITIGDLLLDTFNSGAAVTNSWSNINMNNRDRFLVLMDRKINIATDAGAALTDFVAPVVDYSSQATFNEYIRLNDLETMYKSSTNPAAIGDISVGALQLVTFGNVAAGSEQYKLVYNARLRFSDMNC